MGGSRIAGFMGRGTAKRQWCVLAAVLAAALIPPAAAAIASPAPADCQPINAGGPLFITPQCTDPKLSAPYVDIDKPGQTTDPATGVTVHYRYVHGGFTGSNTRFTFFFPAARDYRGWFIEETYPTVTNEDGFPEAIAFGISHGAYVVTTNNNGGMMAGGVLEGYRANAAAAKFSRIKAAHIYGHIARPRGFIYGASGGAYQTLGAAENTRDVWDGSVPMVPGVPNAIPSFQVTQLLGLRVLGDKLPQIADAVEPGGSGDPYAGLTPDQQSTLREVSRIGFPLRGWWQYPVLRGGAFIAVEGGVRMIDRSYADDFWTKPGYEGSDPSIKALRIQAQTKVVNLTGKAGLVLENVPAGYLLNADLIVKDGARAGTTLKIESVNGNTIQLATTNSILANAQTNETNAGIAPGTTVMLDNSWVIALQYYQRHQVPTPDEYGWNQYRNAQGEPLYPQRPILVGPMMDKGSSGGAVATGHFNGKMIMLASAIDTQAYSWGADWYKKKVEATSDAKLNQNYRLWMMDNADHLPWGPRDQWGSSDAPAPKAADHIVAYQGECEQALLYLNDWVAHGAQPPAGTNYAIDADTQTVVIGDAAQRGGVQPLVSLSVNGGDKIDVNAGQSVTFAMKAQAPAGIGRIVKVEWDLQGAGTYAHDTPVKHPSSQEIMSESYTFTRPGIYFPAVRVSAARDGKGINAKSPYALVQNLARVRVVVH
jgi:hypothetical protein